MNEKEIMEELTKWQKDFKERLEKVPYLLAFPPKAREYIIEKLVSRETERQIESIKDIIDRAKFEDFVENCKDESIHEQLYDDFLILESMNLSDEEIIRRLNEKYTIPWRKKQAIEKHANDTEEK